MDFSHIEHLLPGHLSVAYLLPYFLLVCLHFFAEPARWTIYHTTLGTSRYLLFLRIFSFTAFASYVFPLKMGLPIRVLLLRTKALMSLTEIAGLLFLDGMLYYAFWGASAVVTALGVTQLPKELHFTAENLAVLSIPVGVIALYVVFRLLRQNPNKKTSDTTGSLQSRITDKFQVLLDLYRKIGARALIWTSLVCCVDILTHIFRHWALLQTLGQTLPITLVATVTCISVFSGLLSMMPMGLGGYDIVLALLLTQAGVPGDVALTVPILNRFGNIAASMLLGIWGGWGLGLNPFDLSRLRRKLNIL